MLVHSSRTGAARRRVVALASAALAVGLATSARAAEVRLVASEDCVEVGAVVDEVEGVIGRPLATVPDARFDVEITRVGPRRWRLTLHATDGAATGSAKTQATRVLEGATCAEVASAAAVAIAVAIQGGAGAEGPAPGGEAPPTRASPPAPPAPGPAAPPPVVDAAPGAVPSPPRVLAALLALGDVGSLPGAGVGAELDLGVARGRWRAHALLSAFLPRETDAEVGAAAGGRFNLFLGGLMACGAPRLSGATVTACLGGELGRLSGEGTGATRPRLGSVLWAAGRAEVGLALPLRPGWDLALRGGLSVPLSRPRFQVNGTAEVHQPAVVAGRFAAGVEIAF